MISLDISGDFMEWRADNSFHSFIVFHKICFSIGLLHFRLGSRVGWWKCMIRHALLRFFPRTKNVVWSSLNWFLPRSHKQTADRDPYPIQAVISCQ